MILQRFHMRGTGRCINTWRVLLNIGRGSRRLAVL
jgi:hypothetical protein